MKKMKLGQAVTTATAAGVFASMALGATAQTPASDPLIDVLIKKGYLTEAEAKTIRTEVSNTQTNQVSASKWKIGSAIKSVELYGDLRFRYEYRAADTLGGANGYRERFRYAVRVGLRGEAFDNFYYGLRLETSQNPRSPWVTFGDEKAFPFPGPSSKASDGINLGQAYLGWRPRDWLALEVGRLPNPLYTTGMIWDPDIAPEGAAEKFKYSFENVDLFATFGQFLYQDTDPDHPISPFFGTGGSQSDAFLLAWQLGANIKLNQQTSLKIAPTLYNYTGHGGQNASGQSGGLAGPFVGEGDALVPGRNDYVTPPPTGTPFINQSGINDLLVFTLPGEFNFPLGRYRGRVFGDFAINLNGAARARAAYDATHLPGYVGNPLSHAYTLDNKAYQIGVGVGNLGLVYGQTSKKNTWEARAYWQHTEQYALDVNLTDSDFFEGRGNLEGAYAAFAYSFTDSIIGTVRYGYAQRINKNLGTGGSNQDLPQINPITRYHLLQLDLTWRF